VSASHAASPLRVLHVTQPTTNGVGRYVRDAVGSQSARGWRVAVAAPAAPDFDAACRAAGGEYYRWDAARQPGLSVVAELPALARILRVERPDVVHLHSSKAGLVGRLVLRGRRPTIFSPHAWSFLHGGTITRAAALAWERVAARWTGVLLCVSEAERARAVGARIKAPAEVIPNAVDLASYPPFTAAQRDAARADLAVGSAPLAVCVGRVTAQKGQADLLDAWPAVRARIPAAELLVVGDGPAAPALDARAVPGVRFVGRLDDVRPVMAAADVVVAPSRWEGFSFVVLEAMASGCSVVVTDVDGMREAIGGGPCLPGALVPPRDPPALAEAVARRLADPALVDRKAVRRGRGHATTTCRRRRRRSPP